jgi:hypothetical protein
VAGHSNTEKGQTERKGFDEHQERGRNLSVREESLFFGAVDSWHSAMMKWLEAASIKAQLLGNKPCGVNWLASSVLIEGEREQD